MRKLSGDKRRIKVLETNCILALAVILAGLFAELRILLWAGAIFLAVALFVEKVSTIVATGWLWLAEKLAYVNSMVILTLLFYLLLTPLALLYRIFHRDPLNLAHINNETFFVERNHTYTKLDLEKMW